MSENKIETELMSLVRQFAIDHLQFDPDTMHLGPYKLDDTPEFIFFYIADSNRKPLYLIRAIPSTERNLASYPTLMTVKSTFEKLAIKNTKLLFPIVIDHALFEAHPFVFQAFEWPQGRSMLKLFKAVAAAEPNTEERINAMATLATAVEKVAAALAEFNVLMVKKGGETGLVLSIEDFVSNRFDPFFMYALTVPQRKKLFDFIHKWSAGSPLRSEWSLGIIHPHPEIFNVLINKSLDVVTFFNLDKYRNLSDPTKPPREPIAYNYIWMQGDIELEGVTHGLNKNEIDKILNAFIKTYQKNVVSRMIPPEACNYFKIVFWMFKLGKFEKKFHRSRENQDLNWKLLDYTRKKFFAILDKLP